MSRTKVIAGKNLPIRLPITLSILLWLLLDRLGAPSWVWGVVGTLLAIVWIVAIYAVFTQESVELKELSEYPPRHGEQK